MSDPTTENGPTTAVICDWCGDPVGKTEMRVKLPSVDATYSFTYHVRCYEHVYGPGYREPEHEVEPDNPKRRCQPTHTEEVVTIVEGHTVKMSDRLYVTAGPNRGAPVCVVGFTLDDHEPICQRTDEQPLMWDGSARHVLDIPAYCLSYEEPEATLLEAAEEMLRQWRDCGWYAASVFDDLAAAVERERS